MFGGQVDDAAAYGEKDNENNEKPAKPSRAVLKRKPGKMPDPLDLDGWRQRLSETVPAKRAGIVLEWVRCLGGSTDENRRARLPAPLPDCVGPALTAAVAYYKLEVAPA